jgi:hypothetical protein
VAPAWLLAGITPFSILSIHSLHLEGAHVLCQAGGECRGCFSALWAPPPLSEIPSTLSRNLARYGRKGQLQAPISFSLFFFLFSFFAILEFELRALHLLSKYFTT